MTEPKRCKGPNCQLVAIAGCSYCSAACRVAAAVAGNKARRRGEKPASPRANATAPGPRGNPNSVCSAPGCARSTLSTRHFACCPEHRPAAQKLGALALQKLNTSAQEDAPRKAWKNPNLIQSEEGHEPQTSPVWVERAARIVALLPFAPSRLQTLASREAIEWANARGFACWSAIRGEWQRTAKTASLLARAVDFLDTTE